MVDELFAELPGRFRAGQITGAKTICFTIDGTVKTVTLTAEQCIVEDGKTVSHADCSCSTSEEMLKKIWLEGYRPGIMDFMSGAIAADDPFQLKELMSTFSR